MESIFVKPKFIELHIKDTTRSIFVNVNQIASIESSNIYPYTTFIRLSSDKKITVTESINRIMELLEE
jgi:uncharacterized protein YlzI (FlbEa/FlbD family)